ncbi:BTAD domain-containing putative transcriptional regulator [Streptomyces sp. L7]
MNTPTSSPSSGGWCGPELFREGRWGRLMTALHRCGRDKEALEAYQELYTFLDGELGLGPCEELRALHGGILAAADAGTGWAATAVETPWRGVRPYVTVVGRDHERAELRELALRGGLVTVTGPGGCGKSALALDTARTLTAGFPGGVTVISPAGAGTALPAVLPGPGTGQRALFVLDDCEDLPDPAALARVLLSRPGSTVVATSRAPLRISGEVTWPLSPLPTPKASEETAATRLFVQRAVQATAGFREHRAAPRAGGANLPPRGRTAVGHRTRRGPAAGVLPPGTRRPAGHGPGLPAAPHLRGTRSAHPHVRPQPGPCSASAPTSANSLRLLAETDGEFSLSDVEAAAEPYLLPGRALRALAALVEQSFVHSLDTPAGRRFRLLAPTRAFVA